MKQKALINKAWKYLQDEDGEYLFKLIKDPGKKENMKQKHQRIFQQLKQKYSNWEKTVLQPIPLSAL